MLGKCEFEYSVMSTIYIFMHLLLYHQMEHTLTWIKFEPQFNMKFNLFSLIKPIITISFEY